jgi:hypothetical protein
MSTIDKRPPGGVKAEAYRLRLGYYRVVTAPNLLAAGDWPGLALRHEDEVQWGRRGLGRWTREGQMLDMFAMTYGLAVTMWSGREIVVDNCGLEVGGSGHYFDNRNGGPDAQKAGLATFFSNSSPRALVTAGRVRVEKATVVTEIAGYFEGNSELRRWAFRPESERIRYRMNLWSEGEGALPRETWDWTGDVFSSDRERGTFTREATGRSRVLRSGWADAIFRLRYRLERPLELGPGSYWFSHDVASPWTDAGDPGKAERGLAWGSAFDR